jgi:hypothetical protein
MGDGPVNPISACLEAGLGQLEAKSGFTLGKRKKSIEVRSSEIGRLADHLEPLRCQELLV